MHSNEKYAKGVHPQRISYLHRDYRWPGNILTDDIHDKCKDASMWALLVE